MGAGHVKQVFANWADLDGHPFRLLVYMAVIIPDANKPPRFYGRWETLAFGLGRVVPDEATDDEAIRKERQAALRAVNRATADLVRAKAIRVVERAAPGRNTKYELNLGGSSVDAYRPPIQSEPSMERSTLSGHNAGRSVEQRSTRTGQTVDAERPSPRKEEKEELRTESRNESAGVRVPVTVRAREADATQIDSPVAEPGDPSSGASGDPPLLRRAGAPHDYEHDRDTGACWCGLAQSNQRHRRSAA